MTDKIIANATQADADACNALVPPVAGCPAGGGIRLEIPANFADLIAQGIDVPGCNYARVETQTDDQGVSTPALIVSEAVQTVAANAIAVAKLSPTQRADVVALQTALQAATPATGVTTNTNFGA